MGKVRCLDKHTAELIAAGEVVERPASVVKELVENSIDAGASAITVEIRSGGVSYIRITDDGEGIAHDDVPTAFLRHATSKIATGEDLAKIATLGFRGEALASICAVSRVELITRSADEENGTHYVIEGGEQLVYDECGCAKGTTIIIKDLFYNTPARMKFLKKDVAEGNAVSSMLDRIALSHPEISVQLVREGKQMLSTPGDGKLKSAIYSVFGRDFTAGLIPVDYELKNVRISGYASKPTETRTNHVLQVFFINGRYCRSKTMQAALEEAYKGSVMVGKHPACVINLEIDCEAVDVNVHPAKLEVRFTNERPIFDAVYYGVKSALSENDSRREIKLDKMPRPAVAAPPQQPAPLQMSLPISAQSAQGAAPFGDKAQSAPINSENTDVSAHRDIFTEDILGDISSVSNSSAQIVSDNPIAEQIMSDRIYKSGSYGNIGANIDISADFDVSDENDTSQGAQKDDTFSDKDFSADSKITDDDNSQEAQYDANPENSASAAICDKEPQPYRIIGEAFETYIIIESGEELVLIDKHAAHERLIYERLIAENSGRQAQMLLEPVSVTLDKEQCDILLQNRELLMKGGFDIDDFGFGTIIVRSVPTVLDGGDIEGAIMEIADNLGIKKNPLLTERLENMYHTIACRSAIKAHDRTLDIELAALVTQLIANPDVRYCPHGRPIYITLKKRELEKNFGRV